MSVRKEKINIITLGCSKNTVDSEVLMQQLHANKWELTETSDGSDIAIINTCGFIEAAKQESIDTILQAVELKKEGRLKKVIVMGCLSERYASDLKKEIPDVDAYVGANKMEKVVEALGGDYKSELLGERMLTTPQHFAYLKISEGCDRPCSFCSIPLMRGVHVSKPMERIILEARRLAVLGVKELVIIAQDSTYYGLDLYGKRTLATVLEKLGEVNGIEWIRLMYAFPTGFPEDILEQFNTNAKLCRYIDMPVQHVSDAVLASMRRGITSEKLRALIHRIRTTVPGIALRTTLIVGYPNEGEKEFEELMRFIAETQFDRLGVFTYSQEDGTTAYSLGDPVPDEVKEERRNRIMEVQRTISRTKNEQLIGRTMSVLIDQRDGDVAIGRTEIDAPEVDNEITIHSAGNCSVGHFYPVRVIDAEEYDLFAIPTHRVEAEMEVS
ncbi:MAG: 30S ribosomal protein S12 methylthiotransferase RimO [Ignavibacteriae bacterium]|nr:30S ribosomal protein S12 methylthiotransferase RimO [Ignavibacteria bacterium]MBI3363613.1 30S ribosomal protein S12 methylthiotransferase RimO [Ignavibacteriota bacterium]